VFIRTIGNFSFLRALKEHTIIHEFLLANKVLDIF
jgi:hypothetical protein